MIPWMKYLDHTGRLLSNLSVVVALFLRFKLFFGATIRNRIKRCPCLWFCLCLCLFLCICICICLCCLVSDLSCVAVGVGDVLSQQAEVILGSRGYPTLIAVCLINCFPLHPNSDSNWKHISIACLGTLVHSISEVSLLNAFSEQTSYLSQPSQPLVV